MDVGRAGIERWYPVGTRGRLHRRFTRLMGGHSGELAPIEAEYALDTLLPMGHYAKIC